MFSTIPARLLFVAACVLPLGAWATPSAPASTGSPALASTVGLPANAAPMTGSDRAHLDARDLRTFFAGLVPYMLERNDLAGGVVAVVKDGKLIFAQGYGQANLAKQTPVVADKTLFRVGSISKLFTWTAVMQQVAKGRIDLDRDVNAYLDFKVPEAFGKPVTMRELMTHTAGFEETIRDLAVPDADDMPSLRQYLANNMPARIYPPGKIVAYSNYGAALAAYIVERVTGKPLHAYLARHIFRPLGMRHTTSRQPLPAALRQHLSTGYLSASQRQVAPFAMIVPWPAGAVTSTATDMARFMIAQLQSGQFDGHSILPPATVKRMHSHQYSAAPGMNGFDLGFYEASRNGLRIIGHGGDTMAFHSDLELLPQQHVGIFMSFNSAGKGALTTVRLRENLLDAFLDRYFPYRPPAEKTVTHPERDAGRVAGWYLPSRRSETGLSLLYQLGQVHVSARPDGRIEVSLLQNAAGEPLRWREVGPLDYRQVDGQAHLKFVAGDDGRIRYWISDAFPPVELFQRVHGLKQHGTFRALTLVAIGVLVATALIWFGGWITRRRFGRTLGLRPAQRWWRRASRLGVLALLAVVIGWLVFLGKVAQPLSLLDSAHFGSWLLVLYVIGVLAVAGGVAIVGEAVQRIARGPGGWLRRAGEALLGLCAIYGIWAIFAYGLVSFHFHY